MKKGFTITYEYEGNLYVNTTNRCDYACTFCLRHNESGGGSIYNDNLWLEREPTREEILASIESWDLSKFRQLVFCGFGEPAYRLEDISISLNTDTAEKYEALCRPRYPRAYEAMKAFARELTKYVPTVMMTVVDTIPPEEIESCRKICEEEIGAVYRVREYIAD